MSRTAFVDIFSLLSDRPSDFVLSSRSHTSAQVKIPSKCFIDVLLWLLLAQKLIDMELPVNLIADIWQGSLSKCFFPLLEIVFFQILKNKRANG